MNQQWDFDRMSNDQRRHFLRDIQEGEVGDLALGYKPLHGPQEPSLLAADITERGTARILSRPCLTLDDECAAVDAEMRLQAENEAWEQSLQTLRSIAILAAFCAVGFIAGWLYGLFGGHH